MSSIKYFKFDELNDYKLNPYLVDNFHCGDLDELKRMRFFIRSSFCISEKIDIDEYSEFELFKKENNIFYYRRDKFVYVSVYWSWCKDLNFTYLSTYLGLVKNSIYDKEGLISKYEILLYPSNPRDANKINIQVTGEHKLVRHPNIHFDLGYELDVPRKMIYPYFCQMIDLYPKFENLFLETNNINIPENFCAFFVSNPKCLIRNYIFTFISQKYKLVHSYGKVLNNMGKVYDHFDFGSDEHVLLLGTHKFVICFENERNDNDFYITEKIINAKLSGAIPVYWGTKKCLEIFEPNTFLYLDQTNDKGFDKLLNEIIDLDQNDQKYLEMRNKRMIDPNKISKMRNTYFTKFFD